MINLVLDTSANAVQIAIKRSNSDKRSPYETFGFSQAVINGY